MSSERTLLGMDIDSNDETAMWERARGGDGVAFASLFTRHQDRVYRRALTLVSQVSNAEDVTATAFFELWRRRNSVRLVEGSIIGEVCLKALARTEKTHAGCPGFDAEG